MRTLLSFVGVVGVGYLALVLLVFVAQGRLLFLPHIAGRGLVTTPGEYGMAFEEVHLITEDGERLHGWWVPAPGGERSAYGTVLVFHGNAGNISHRMDTLRIWYELGWNAFIFDYRGYGRSTGRPMEEGTYRDARAAWRHVTEERETPPERVVLFGRSLGGAVAARLATEVEPMALILESTFTSVPDLGAELYRWLPVRLLSRLSYATVDALPAVRAPVLIVHSPADEIIPFHHARALYEAARPPKAFLELVGGHNEGFYLTGDAYIEGLAGFLEEVKGSSS